MATVSYPMLCREHSCICPCIRIKNSSSRQACKQMTAPPELCNSVAELLDLSQAHELLIGSDGGCQALHPAVAASNLQCLDHLDHQQQLMMMHTRLAPSACRMELRRHMYGRLVIYQPRASTCFSSSCFRTRPRFCTDKPPS